MPFRPMPLPPRDDEAVVRLSLHHEKRHPINGAFSRGGAKGIRTPDLLNAIQTRYQLRYNPIGKPIIQETA